MLGFNSFRRAQTLQTGIELIQMVLKGNINIRKVRGYQPLDNFICWLPK
ncbi:Uncharacterised protein [Serratia fonticola]|nr:Uncharacterised protein [Serratia fonticola]